LGLDIEVDLMNVITKKDPNNPVQNKTKTRQHIWPRRHTSRSNLFVNALLITGIVMVIACNPGKINAREPTTKTTSNSAFETGIENLKSGVKPDGKLYANFRARVKNKGEKPTSDGEYMTYAICFDEPARTCLDGGGKRLPSIPPKSDVTFDLALKSRATCVNTGGGKCIPLEGLSPHITLTVVGAKDPLSETIMQLPPIREYSE